MIPPEDPRWREFSLAYQRCEQIGIKSGAWVIRGLYVMLGSGIPFLLSSFWEGFNWIGGFLMLLGFLIITLGVLISARRNGSKSANEEFTRLAKELDIDEEFTVKASW